MTLPDLAAMTTLPPWSGSFLFIRDGRARFGTTPLKAPYPAGWVALVLLGWTARWDDPDWPSR